MSKSKNAQEAHEAIRPTDLARRPKDVKKMLDHDQARLYELIWLRTIASQMESAELERTTVDITAKAGARTIDLRANGTVVKFDGFLTLYTEDQDDKTDDEDANRLPQMASGEALQKREIAATQHFTEPPPRYSEASLVKRMEELGIGRPSTYASILQVLRDRGYVRLDKKRLVPEDKGRVLVAFLENFFLRYVEYDFTANLEEQLDKISNNELPYKDVLRDFWKDFIGAVGDIKELRIAQVIDALDEMLAPHLFPPKPDGTDPRKCPNCENGRIGLKLGRFGGFVGCSNYPECKFTRQLSVGADGAGRRHAQARRRPRHRPRSHRALRPLRQLSAARRTHQGRGRRGGEAQAREPAQGRRARRDRPRPRGEAARPAPHHRQASRRRRGHHRRRRPLRPLREARQDLRQHRATTKTSSSIGLNRAVTLIEEKKLNPGKGRRFGADPGKQLGEHPQKGGMIVAKNGRYGPYVSHNGVNANLPNEKTPETITLDEAVGLIDARAESGGGSSARRKRPARGAPAKKAAAPKARRSQAEEARRGERGQGAAQVEEGCRGGGVRSHQTTSYPRHARPCAGHPRPPSRKARHGWPGQTRRRPSAGYARP